MIGLRELTLIKNNGGDLSGHIIHGNWQGTNAVKAAALGTAFANSITVRIPLTELTDFEVCKHDLIALGAVDTSGKTEKQLITELSGRIMRINSINMHDRLSEYINHVEVTGS